MQPVLQPGNEVEAVWRARLEEHLGLYAVEAAALRTDAAAFERRRRCTASICSARCCGCCPNATRIPALFERAQVLLPISPAPLAPALFVHFELALLAELGFGLDLDQCAATGSRENLVYVSPKRARAVSRDAGAPWAAKLLPLPDFLLAAPGAPVSREKICEGFRLTEFFFARDVFRPARTQAAGRPRRLYREFLIGRVSDSLSKTKKAASSAAFWSALRPPHWQTTRISLCETP